MYERTAAFRSRAPIADSRHRPTKLPSRQQMHERPLFVFAPSIEDCQRCPTSPIRDPRPIRHSEFIMPPVVHHLVKRGSRAGILRFNGQTIAHLFEGICVLCGKSCSLEKCRNVIEKPSFTDQLLRSECTMTHFRPCHSKLGGMSLSAWASDTADSRSLSHQTGRLHHGARTPCTVAQNEASLSWFCGTFNWVQH
jgi:hypothetical protein